MDLILKIMIKLYLILILNVLASAQASSKISPIPLNLRDALANLNNQQTSVKNLMSLNLIGSIKLWSIFLKQLELEELETTLSANVSKDCANQWRLVLNGARHQESWALQVFDSYGKLPSGLFQNNFAWLGEFTQCRNISVSILNSTLRFNYILLAKHFMMHDIVRPYAGIVSESKNNN